MDLTFQVSYVILFFTASDLLLPPDTSTTEHHFCFGPVTSFFPELLEIALSSSRNCPQFFPSSTLDTFRPGGGGSLSGVISFAFSYCSWGSHGRNTGVVCCSLPMDHVLSDVSTKTRSSWVALHGMAHDFTELCKPLCHNKAMIHEGVDHQGSPLTS